MLSWLFNKNSKKKIQLPKNFTQYLDPEAVDIVNRLQKAGFETYLVGGCVRDILLGKKAKDFDIATAATPQQVKALIHRAFIIGKRFRIVVAKRNDNSFQKHSLFPVLLERRPEKEFQITTFRRKPVMVNGLLNENVFGTAKEDASRRDFSLNALFLDPNNGKIVDFVGGLDDLKRGELKIIGDPTHRFKEDPIRILRALRFKAKAELKLESKTENALRRAVQHLKDSRRERIREEIVKMLREGSLKKVSEDLKAYNIWPLLLPSLGKELGQNAESLHNLGRVSEALRSTPWQNPMIATPLFYIFIYCIEPLRPKLGHKVFQAFFEDIKLSKAEKEGLDFIRFNLNRMTSYAESKQPEKFFHRAQKDLAATVQSFYVLKILSSLESSPYKKVWPLYETHWEKFSLTIKGGSPPSPSRFKHHKRGRHSSAPARRASTHGATTPATATAEAATSTTHRKPSSS